MSPLSRRPRMGKSLRRTSRPGNRPGSASIRFPLVSLGFETLAGARSSTSGAGLDVLVVALSFELVGELGAAFLDHPAVHEEVHEVGGDVAQDPGVVRDQQDALVRVLLEPVDAL